jgi:hypothetical protein
MFWNANTAIEGLPGGASSSGIFSRAAGSVCAADFAS